MFEDAPCEFVLPALADLVADKEDRHKQRAAGELIGGESPERPAEAAFLFFFVVAAGGFAGAEYRFACVWGTRQEWFAEANTGP